MKVAGIVAEYNPFHNGHAYLIEKARENGATHVVAVMSSNFVQRGEPAVFDCDVRTRAALMNGVDLVVQLPSVYAVSNAQSFARSSVEVLDASGIVDELVFGSECGSIREISGAVSSLGAKELKPLLDDELKKGISFASARENALRMLDCASADIIRSPNNILGVEYVSALKEKNSRISPVTFCRAGAEHDSGITNDAFASASNIRRMLACGEEWKDFVPDNVISLYESCEKSDIGRIENAVLYSMRTADREALAKAPDVSEGIENRLLTASLSAKSLDELYAAAKTKRYSHARIRRIVFNHFLGFTADDLSLPVPYIRVLGFNSEGSALIRKAKNVSRLPVITKAADLSRLGENAQRIFSLECRAGDIYSLCFANNGSCGEEKRRKPVII